MNVKKKALALGSVLMLFAATSNAQTWSEIWQDMIDLQKSSWDFGVKGGSGGTRDVGIGGTTFRSYKKDATSSNIATNSTDIGDNNWTDIGDNNWRVLGKLGAFLEGRLGRYFGAEVDVLVTGLFPNYLTEREDANMWPYGGGLATSLVGKWFPMGYSNLDGGLEFLGGVQVDTPFATNWWTNTQFKGVVGLGYTFARDTLLVGGGRIQIRKTSQWSWNDLKSMNNITLSFSKSLVGGLSWLDMDEE